MNSHRFLAWMYPVYNHKHNYKKTQQRKKASAKDIQLFPTFGAFKRFFFKASTVFIGYIPFPHKILIEAQ
jgi:hypothetical protein